MTDQAPQEPLHVRLRPSRLTSAGLAYTTDFNALAKVWQTPDRPRVWLFSGDPGCGKTTVARVLANELSIEYRLKTGDESAEVLVKEINTSDKTGVDFARSLVDDAAMRAPWPIVTILDECHQLTKSAQNALLKLLEEPPADHYYFLCTTDPQKLVAAIQSRAKTVHFRPLSKANAILWLNKVTKHLGKEALPVDLGERMWTMANGGPRKLLQLLQSYLSTGKLDDIAETVGDLDIPALAQAILKHSKFSESILPLLKNSSYDPEGARRALSGYVLAVLFNTQDASKIRRTLTALEHLTVPIFQTGQDARAALVVRVLRSWQEFKP
jgi:DNA polymerase-3 subunit gamma/tau